MLREAVDLDNCSLSMSSRNQRRTSAAFPPTLPRPLKYFLVGLMQAHISNHESAHKTPRCLQQSYTLRLQRGGA